MSNFVPFQGFFYQRSDRICKIPEINNLEVLKFFKLNLFRYSWAGTILRAWYRLAHLVLSYMPFGVAEHYPGGMLITPLCSISRLCSYSVTFGVVKMDCSASSTLCSGVPYFTNNGPQWKSASFCVCQKWGCKNKKLLWGETVTIVDLIGLAVAKNTLQFVKCEEG